MVCKKLYCCFLIFCILQSCSISLEVLNKPIKDHFNKKIIENNYGNVDPKKLTDKYYYFHFKNREKLLNQLSSVLSKSNSFFLFEEVNTLNERYFAFFVTNEVIYFYDNKNHEVPLVVENLPKNLNEYYVSIKNNNEISHYVINDELTDTYIINYISIVQNGKLNEVIMYDYSDMKSIYSKNKSIKINLLNTQ